MNGGFLDRLRIGRLPAAGEDINAFARRRGLRTRRHAAYCDHRQNEENAS
jgi:hypothetical protein